MDNNYSTQPALVDLLLRRDPKGCEHLCEIYSARLYGYIIRMVDDPKVAGDLLEKTLRKICKNIHQFKHSQLTFLSWALQFARSESIDYLCVKKPKGTPVSRDDKNQDDTEAINDLEILNMIQQGYKVYEVAGILNLPVEKIKISIRKAMKRLINQGN